MSLPPILETIRNQELADWKPEDLVPLLTASPNGQTVVTMVMPMERKGAATRKNHIVFKNALSQAAGKLSYGKQKHGGIAEMLRALGHLDDAAEPFWQDQDKGLVMVVAEQEGVTAYKLPFPVQPFVWVGPLPYLRPLLRLLDCPSFYILALDLKELALYEATPWGAKRLPLNHVPTSLDEAMKFDDPEKSLQFRTVSPSNLPGAGGGDVAFHGHGVTGDETRNKKIDRFFEMVAHGLSNDLPDAKTPVVLFGAAPEAGRFRKIYRNAHRLHDGLIDRNPSGLTSDEFEGVVTQWVQEREADRQTNALAALKDALGEDRATTSTGEVVKAAAAGRASALFIRAGERRYGHLDEATSTVRFNDPPEDDDVELLAEAAIRAATSGAEIHYLERGTPLPADAPVAAILRY